MTKGYCEKREDKDCDKCFHENEYYIDEPPCKYFVFYKRGFEGKLEDINGKKMRRQWFFTPAVLSAGFIIWLLIAAFISGLLFGSETSQEDKGYISLLFTRVIIPFEFLLFCLSIPNIKLWGKTVAVLTDEGIYTNQAFLKWNEISEIEFSPRMLYRGRTDDCAYTKIVSKKGTFKIAHMPLYFLLCAKKYKSEIKIKINRKKVRFYVILFSLSFIVPLIYCIFD